MVPEHELEFWRMIERLSDLTREQADRLYERMWILDIERLFSTRGAL